MNVSFNKPEVFRNKIPTRRPYMFISLGEDQILKVWYNVGQKSIS